MVNKSLDSNSDEEWDFFGEEEDVNGTNLNFIRFLISYMKHWPSSFF